MTFIPPVTIAAQGTQLKKGSAVLVNLLSVSGVGFDVGERKTTHLGSTAGSRRPTLATGSDAEFEVNYHPSQHAALVLAGLNRETAVWQLVPPSDDAATPVVMPDLPFTAWTKKFEFGGIEEDGTWKGTFTLAITDDLAGLGAAPTSP